jgi:hypothetical protein
MATTVRFDPRMLIGPPFGPCPKCGAVEFGTASINKFSFTRQCRACRHSAIERLPALHKKLIYLDQMAASGMAKTLDPVWAAKVGPQHERWSKMFDALERAFKLQLMVCPQSSVHEKESALASQPAMLNSLYEHLGNGMSFQHPVIIHQHQLGVALRAALRDEALQYNLHRHLVLHGDPDVWMERIRISVNLGLAPDPLVQRRVRARSYAAMVQWFERWKAEKDKSFQYWYRLERQGHAITYKYLFEEHLALVAQVMRGEAPLTEAVWDPRLEAGVISALAHLAEEAGHRADDALRVVVRFLFSDAAFDAPANDISALLMAALARKAANGQKRAPSPGMWNDITAIAAFLPYCDAMFLDNECAGLLREEPLRTKLVPFGTSIFSSKTGDEFLEYLAGLEQEAGAEHVGLVARVYGDDWTVPYREVLIHERERKTREARSAT